MTTADLITELQKLPPDALVYVYAEGACYNLILMYRSTYE